MSFVPLALMLWFKNRQELTLCVRLAQATLANGNKKIPLGMINFVASDLSEVLLTQLHQNPMTRFWVQKGYEFVVSTFFWFFIEYRKPFFF